MTSPAIQTSPPFHLERSHDHGWVVDLVTRRIARRQCVFCDAAASAEAEQAERKDLMDVVKEVREALEEGAEAMPQTPAVRMLPVEDGEHLAPPALRVNRGKRKPPVSAEVHPSPKEIGKEHRGY